MHTCSTMCSIILNFWIQTVSNFISGFWEQCCAPADLCVYSASCKYYISYSEISCSNYFLKEKLYCIKHIYFILFIKDNCTLECMNLQNRTQLFVVFCFIGQRFELHLQSMRLNSFKCIIKCFCDF